MDEGSFLQGLDPSHHGFGLEAAGGVVPPFSEPWYAQAFGTVLALSKAGLFAWAEWVDVFSGEIRTNPQRDGENGEQAYYRQWLAALESILQGRGMMRATDIVETAEHWRRSYLHTPHGKPIVFSRDWAAPMSFQEHSHDDHHHGHEHGHLRVPQPVSVSPANRRVG